MPTYHPAFLLRSYTKENRAKVWSDLQQAAKKLGLATPGRAATS
jgi:uracil-DNA glycosylase